ncbi:MAG: cellulose binding domain-containing protein [Polyangiaceae bacterium]
MNLNLILLASLVGTQVCFACATSGELQSGSSGGRSSSGGVHSYGGASSTLNGGSAFASGGAFGSGGVSAPVSGGTASVGSGGMAAGGVPDSVLENASVVLYHQSDVTDVTTNRIFMRMFIENRADAALPMAQVSVRYWMVSELAAPGLHSYYAGSNISGQTLSFVEAGADSYVDVRFTGNSIPKGADLNLSEFQVQIDGGTFNQANDFSFAPSDVQRAPNEKITVYLAGRLIWGCEPSGACPGDVGGAGGAGGAGGETSTGGAGPDAGGAGPDAGGAGGVNAGGGASDGGAGASATF